MPPRSLEIGPAGIQAARTIETLRAERGLSQRRLASRVTALGHPMSNTMLSRIERAQRRCDVDDLTAIAEALCVPASVFLETSPSGQTACTRCGT
jgi:transcriptional regulator with XRE-family HTH domain